MIFVSDLQAEIPAVVFRYGDGYGLFSIHNRNAVERIAVHGDGGLVVYVKQFEKVEGRMAVFYRA